MSVFSKIGNAVAPFFNPFGSGGLLSTPEAPAAPDANALMRQQAEMNRFDQRTPWGSTVWSQGPDGRWTQTVKQSTDAAQAQRQLGLFNNQIPTNLTQPSLATGQWALAQPQAQSVPGLPQSRGVQTPWLPQAAQASALPQTQTVTPWALPQLPGGDYAAQRDQVTNSIFSRGADLINQQADRDQRRLDQKLANQGLPMGGEAFNEQQRLQQQGVMDARSKLALDAILAGGQEQSRMAGLDLSRYGAGLQGAQTGFGQNLAASQNNFGQGVTLADLGYNQRAGQVAQQAGLAGQRFGMDQSEASRLFGEGMQRAGTGFDMQRAAQQDAFNNTLAGSGQAFSQNLAANQQNFGQNLAAQQQLINVLMARMGNYQAPQAAMVDAYGPAQLQQAALNNAYQGQLARQQGILGGLGNLGGAAIMAGM